ncbi:MAG: methyltransferase domain-containing protein [Rhodospirillales bacterium]|nr:methyltransferase domain-containing protein [Rhodospirillales bacterium]
MNLSRRVDTPERMDTDCLDYADYQRCLRDLSRVNRTTFTLQPTLRWLGRQGLQAGERFSVLDVASGYGDMLRAIRRWSMRRGLDAELVGIDRNPWAVQAARDATPAEDRIDYIATDVFSFSPVLPFDFIVSAQFAHHLTDVEVVAFVRWMERFARRGWIISDIHRSAAAYFGFNLLAIAARWHHFVRSDGLISITRGFRPNELAALIGEVVAANAVTIRRHLPFRLTVERSR